MKALFLIVSIFLLIAPSGLAQINPKLKPVDLNEKENESPSTKLMYNFNNITSQSYNIKLSPQFINQSNMPNISYLMNPANNFWSGEIKSNSFTIESYNFNTIYIFDVNGNLKSSSFSIGRKKN